MKIVISDHLHADGLDLLRDQPGIDIAGPFETRSDLFAGLADADALIIRSSTLVDQELLNAAPALRVVARAGARIDNIDMDEVTRRGIMAIHAPEANLYAVAEYTFALLLALARRLTEGVEALRVGGWLRHSLLGFQLHGKTMGILGYGKLGREVARRAQAFGMTILAYDPYADIAAALADGVEVVDFSELLQRADVISLHTTFTGQTHPMMDRAAFSQMKPGAFLVNCAEGALVDELALLATLESGHLGGAALDTFRIEPPDVNSPLLKHPRILASPHLNQNTVESQSETSRQVVADVLAALRHEDYRNVANLPFTRAAPYVRLRPYVELASRLGKLLGQMADGWIEKLEVDLLGEGMDAFVRPVAAVLLSGMLRFSDGRSPNWVSAPLLAQEQGVKTAQVKNLLPLGDYPNLLTCRVSWQGGSRTVAGVLFANGAARLVHYDGYWVDAVPDGYVLILENDDVPGVIGKVGGRLGKAGINISNWRYGRETRGGRALSFINLDQPPGRDLLVEFEQEPEIHKARLARL